MTSTEVVQIVARRLPGLAKTIGVHRFDVIEDKVYTDESNLWHVHVRPDVHIEEQGRFYDLLNRTEREIQASENVNVLIIPLQPKPATSSGNAA